MRTSFWVWCLQLVFITFVPLTSWAQTAPEASIAERPTGPEGQWSWQDVRRKVEGGSAAVNASLSGVDAAKAWELGAGAWPNPEVALELLGFGGTRPWLGPEEASIGVRQSIPLTARRDREKELAGAGVQKAQAEAQGVMDALRAKAWERFVRALALRDKAELERQSLLLAERAARLVEIRVKAGALPDSEVKRSQATLALAKLGVSQAEREAKAALGALAAVWGGKPNEVGGVSGNLASLPMPTSLEALAGQVGSAPGLKSMEAEVSVLEGQAAVEEAASIPDLALGVGTVFLGEFSDTALMLSVEWPLPLFDQNKGRIDEAKARTRQAQQNIDAWKIEWLSAVLEAHAAYGLHFERQEILSGQVIPALEAASDAVEKGFQNGQLTTLDLLESQRALLESKLELLDARQQAWQAALALDYLTGQLGKTQVGGVE